MSGHVEDGYLPSLAEFVEWLREVEAWQDANDCHVAINISIPGFRESGGGDSDE